jgi:hypothetical protein
MSDAPPGIGDLTPPIELPDTEGNLHTLPMPGEATATVIVWTCNHCPYARAWHDRVMEVAHEYAPQGVRTLHVNSNDATRYPADSLDEMKARVTDEEWAGPYLHDEGQEAARAWGAEVTPHVFVLDMDLRLRYSGAPDSDYDDPEQNAGWLREALDALLVGKQPENSRTEPVGCSIKWKG